jgi:trans-2,3-dihydro-3-hydroxyanthranilate isomerase
MRFRYVLADVFTDRPFTGNPLAVFPEARGLDPEWMARIAAELNLSESVFVSPPRDPAHTRSVRIFTPARELPFAGHPTVGTAYVLVADGQVPATPPRVSIVLEEEVGPVPVTVSIENGRATTAEIAVPRAPARGPESHDAARVARLLSLEAADVLADAWRPEAWSAGVPFLFVPVRDVAALGRAQLNAALWSEQLASSWSPDVYLVTWEGERGGSRLRTRMFGPSMRVVEDPATGAAAAALAGFLGARTAPGPCTWTIMQGVEMGRPSRIDLRAEALPGGARDVRVAGRSVIVGEGWLEIPG